MSTEIETTKEITALEHAWAKAMQARDVARLERIVTDDFLVTLAPQGMPIQVTRRERWLSVMPTYDIQSMTLEDMHISLYGELAVVALTLSQRASINGGDRSGSFFITDVWRKTPAGWRVAERHSSRPEPAGAARPQ